MAYYTKAVARGCADAPCVHGGNADGCARACGRTLHRSNSFSSITASCRSRGFHGLIESNPRGANALEFDGSTTRRVLGGVKAGTEALPPLQGLSHNTLTTSEPPLRPGSSEERVTGCNATSRRLCSSHRPPCHAAGPSAPAAGLRPSYTTATGSPPDSSSPSPSSPAPACDEAWIGSRTCLSTGCGNRAPRRDLPSRGGSRRALRATGTGNNAAAMHCRHGSARNCRRRPCGCRRRQVR